jgi:hypothetical protein
MKAFSQAGKFCAVSVLVISMLGLAACGSDDTGNGKGKNLRHGRTPFGESANGAPHISVRHRANIALRPSTVPEVSAPPTLAPFLGNLGAVPASPGNGLTLQRQADCSLLFSNFAFSIETSAVSATIDSQTPHYEKIMRDNAFLTTPAGTFPNGCADQTAGTTSRIALYLGAGKSGQLIAAGLANGGVYAGAMDTENDFYTPAQLVTDLPALSIMSGDLNKDGNQDVISINDDGLNSSVDVFLGNGDGTFQTATKFALAGTVAQFGIVDDMNGDGNLDMVIGVSTRGVFQFLIYLGDGHGGFAAPVGFSPNQVDLSFASTFITADVNGDGHKDIITSEGQVFLGQASGTNFSLAVQAFSGSVDTSNMYAPGLVAADFNNDHKLDLAADDGASIRIFLGNGDGTFTTGPAYPAISNRGFLVATDLDGDGNIDLYSGFGNSGAFGGDDFLPSLSYALLGNGDGTFQGAPELPIKYTGTNLLDLNNDGRPDMVGLITGPTQTTLTTFLTGSNGIPVAGPELIIPNGVGVDSYALGAFNTNSNTIPGLLYLTASPQVQTFNLALGVGNGSFQAPTSFPVPSLVPTGNDINESLTGLRTGDFNHDGKLDIAYSFSDQASDTQIFYEGFAVQLGNGDGTFQAPKITLTFQSATAPQVFPSNMLSGIADVNNDNFPDVFMIVPNGISNGELAEQVLLFVGHGDGTFKAPNTLTLTPNIRPSTPDGLFGSPFAFGDLNGDGNMDIVASGSSADGTTPQLAIALGNGDGTFKSPAILVFQGFGFPSSPAIEKFTGGGKMDLYVDGVGEGIGLGIFPGNGDGTFQTISNGDGTVSPPQQIVLAVVGGALAVDLNNDGVPDLISGNVVLLNKSGAVQPGLAATTTAVTSSMNPSTTGTNVTFTATVTSATAGTITGTVTFLDGATALGTGSLAGGTASFTTSSLATGSHSITAQYGGDPNFSGSTSTALSINVTAGGSFTLSVAPTSVTVTASQPGMATVTVTPANGFNQQVQFSCSNLPEGIDCEFEPHSVTPNGGPVTTMLAVTEEAESGARGRKSGAAIGTWFGGGSSRFTLPRKTVFVPALGCELLLLAGLWLRRKSATQRRGLQFAFTVILLVTLATFVGGCSSMPHSRNTGATITVIGTGPGNQSVMVPLTINIRK